MASMAKKPLEVMINNLVDGEVLEFLAGPDKQHMEPVGKITEYDLEHFSVTSYTAYKTKAVNSFVTRTTPFTEKSFTEQMAPDEEIFLSFGDKIGWGYTRPLVAIQPAYSAE